MPQSASGRIYFPGLNGLRFLAAAMVIVSHIEQFKKEEGLPNLDHTTLIGTAGEYGVSLFFVLSGVSDYLPVTDRRENDRRN